MRTLGALVALLCAGCNSSPAAPAAGSEPIRQVLQAVVRQAHQQGFTGAALVARDGVVLLDQGIGAVNGVALGARSRFWIASAGKQFTAAAILLCAERGLLSLDAPLSSALPSVPADKARITIRQILSYTSGLPASDAGEIAPDAQTALDQVLALPLAAAPGERFIYANANYVLAAALVERSTGVPFSDFVRREILDRAGLADSGQAVGPGDHGLSPILGELPPRLRSPRWSAFAYYSTTGDWYRWIEALQSGRVLSRRSAEALFAPVAPIQEGHAALGWFTGTSARGSRRIFTRGNEDMGASASVYYYPDQAALIVVLTHAGNASPDLSWSRELHQRLESALEL